jgi:secreted PhoX family phosphatase
VARSPGSPRIRWPPARSRRSAGYAQRATSATEVRPWLLDGFNYRSFHDTESPVVLDDGTALPGRHDGMGAFTGPDGTVILVRNHEINNPGAPFGDPSAAYDAMAPGRRRFRSHRTARSSTRTRASTASRSGIGIAAAVLTARPPLARRAKPADSP